MNNQDQGRNSANWHQHGKYRKYSADLKRVFEYLTKHNATQTMVAVALDIYRPNLCRQKRELEDQGRLMVTHRGICKETGCKADYLTCNPEIIERGKNG